MQKTLLFSVFLVFVASCVYGQVLGPTNTPLSGATITFNNGLCKVCEVDCLHPDFNGLFSRCNFRYYRYGCHIKSYCFRLGALNTRDFSAALSFCVMYNGCVANTRNINQFDPAEKRRVSAETKLDNDNSSNRRYFGTITKDYKWQIIQRRKQCARDLIFAAQFSDPEFVPYYANNNERAAYDAIKNQFLSWQIDKWEFYRRVYDDCSMTFLFVDDYRDNVKKDAENLFQSNLNTIEEDTQTKVKSIFFNRASISRNFLIYFKVTQDVKDNWETFMTNPTALNNYLKDLNTRLKSIPNAISQLDGSNDIPELRSEHILNLKVQAEKEGGVRAERIWNVITDFSNEATDYFVRLRKTYPNLSIQEIDNGIYRKYLKNYADLVADIDKSYATKLDVRYNNMNIQVESRNPTQLDLVNFFFGQKRDLSLKIEYCSDFQSWRQNNPPLYFSVEYAASENEAMQETIKGFFLGYSSLGSFTTQSNGRRLYRINEAALKANDNFWLYGESWNFQGSVDRAVRELAKNYPGTAPIQKC